jgi:hypothetical protein
MGYSVRDARWRLTVWKSRRDNHVTATELYDEERDASESVNLADKPEHEKVVAALMREIPAEAAPLKKAKAKAARE